MKKKIIIVGLVISLALLFVCCGNEDIAPVESSLPETEVETEPVEEFGITYELDGGSWNKTYYTVEELWDQFKTQYNAAGGKLENPSDLDAGSLDSSEFAKIYNSTKMYVNWCWLYSAVWEAGGKDSSLNPRSCNMTTDQAKGFFLCQLCGFFSGSKHTDSVYKTVSADYSDTSVSTAVAENGPSKDTDPGPEKYIAGQVTPIKGLNKYLNEFLGWRIGDSEEIVHEIDASVRGDITLTAVWKAPVLPEEVIISNIPTEGITLYSSYQLEWQVTPADSYNTRVIFSSLTSNILSISDKGVLTAKATGTGKIKIRLAGQQSYEKTVEIKVIRGNFFKVKYCSESYTTVGKDIGLESVWYDAAGKTQKVTWKSLTPDIATVDSEGKVHPLKPGLATIRSSYGTEHYIDFTVTVLNDNISPEMQFILDSHNSNALTVYNLGIGDGTPAYYYDVVGGVSDLLFADLIIDKQYYGKLSSGQNNYGPMDSVEFVTVHYTGNMNLGADADNNASYMGNVSAGVSIHYVTGRSNQPQYGGEWSEDSYAAFASLNEDYGAWHATTGNNKVIWDKSGVKAEEGDPEKPVISISDDLYYTINGKKTQIKIPELPDGYSVKGDSVTANGKTAKAINSMGLATKVCDGEYCIARTWWGKQRTPKELSTYGGNTNSIGIESCVDIGSDLMHTWHVTAQLVADILNRKNLGLDRVVGHHFFSGKDCPQPMLENDLQLWYEFMDMVGAEYRRITEFKDVKFTAKAVSGKDYLSDKGLLRQGAESQIVTYEVTIEKDGKTETVTLATAVESSLCYTGSRKMLSLQNQNYDIK